MQRLMQGLQQKYMIRSVLLRSRGALTGAIAGVPMKTSQVLQFLGGDRQ
jgi:hypothetical protein